MAQDVYAVLHEENGIFGISFPDFPGVVSGGETAEEAIARGRDALAFHVAGMIEDGDPLPSLRSLSELRKDGSLREDFADGVLVLVPVDLPGKSVRVNITMDESLLDRIDRAAAASGETRSGYLAKSAKSRLASTTA
jgi:predicted RNase H-like HicB family nuclease